jgi:hypothetical protein
MNYQYQAFGLNISSEVELPNLLPGSNAPADLRIEYGAIDISGLDGAEPIGRYAQCAENRYWFRAPDIARFIVSDGDHILVEPEQGADPQSVRLYLLGSAIGAIMHQREQLVLHGNAIRFGDQCVVFAGNSGNGKSTLAAALYQEGHEVLSDDLAVIDREFRVQPSYPQLKLWQDTARKLELDTTQLKRIRLQVEKYAYPLTTGFCTTPLPIAALYILHTHNDNDFKVERIKGMEKFTPLKNHTYRSRVLDGLGLEAAHLRACGELVKRIQLTHLTRPNHGFDLDTLITTIKADLVSMGIVA